MWNHAPQMWARMQKEKVAPPTFNEHEMSDLLAYLYTLRYIGETGNADRGGRLFERKVARPAIAVQGR